MTGTEHLDLTGDRPITLPEARKLAKWWNGRPCKRKGYLWVCSLIQTGRLYSVVAYPMAYLGYM